MVNYWTDIVTRQLFFCSRFIHPGWCSGALVHPSRARSLSTSLDVSVVPCTDGTRSLSWSDRVGTAFLFLLAKSRQFSAKKLGKLRRNICFPSANWTDFHHFWLNFVKSFDLKKWEKNTHTDLEEAALMVLLMMRIVCIVTTPGSSYLRKGQRRQTGSGTRVVGSTVPKHIEEGDDPTNINAHKWEFGVVPKVNPLPGTVGFRVAFQEIPLKACIQISAFFFCFFWGFCDVAEVAIIHKMI